MVYQLPVAIRLSINASTAAAWNNFRYFPSVTMTFISFSIVCTQEYITFPWIVGQNIVVYQFPEIMAQCVVVTRLNFVLTFVIAFNIGVLGIINGN